MEAGHVIGLGAPIYLALVVVVALMAFVIVRIARWRREARNTFAGPQADTWTSASFWPRFVILLAAAAVIVFAAARPQWGSNEQVRDREGIDLVIVFDVSLSMMAEDVAPTRMAMAQENLVALVEAQRGSRIGMVFFAGNAFLRSPLTADTQAMAQIIRRADREAGLTRAGSDLGSGLQEALRAFEASDNAGRAVILVSDGEDHQGTFQQAAAALREQGVTIFTAGVGTPQGSDLWEEHQLTGVRTRRLLPNGQPVITRLEEQSLIAIAEAGGGQYVRLQDPRSLLALRNDLSRLDQTPFGSERQQIPIERFQIFVGFALLLLLLSWFLPGRLALPALARLRRARPHPGMALLLLALFAGACTSDPLREHNQQANRLFEQGDFQGALEAYQQLLAQRPDIDELSYNSGNSLHRLENFERAVAETQRALPPNNDRIGAITYYALGNHLLALERLEEAFDAYRNALLLNPGDSDAKHNLELTLLLLNERNPPAEEPQPQVPQPGQSGPGENGEPAPGENGEPGQNAEPQPGQPAPGGQPQPGGIPERGQMSPQELQRALEEALRGIDDEVTFEEAVRILDLLRQQQERRIIPRGTPVGPDY
jgi:tetratricopeptide (TPR) repeat protein